MTTITTMTMLAIGTALVSALAVVVLLERAVRRHT